MKITGLHLILTYKCIRECDHCFVWGSPKQHGTMTLGDIERILEEAGKTGTVEWIYFEGGEPFLYYAVLRRAVEMAAGSGYRVGVVTNAYWATSAPDAAEWLGPFAGTIEDLSISSDLFHGPDKLSSEARAAFAAAKSLGMPVGIISIAEHADNPAGGPGQIPIGWSQTMYRGRAADELAPDVEKRPWRQFTECRCENLRDPGRLHVDPFGHVHICQGISIGNLFRQPLREICETYDPDGHPVVGPLLVGGPAELVRRYGVRHEESYADPCHLCFQARRALREKFPDILAPDSMYGVFQGPES